ncbi:MAG TPA: hypothetical protein VL588_09465, partial [Bdellovibrionota bacterium]|nr:hypothetical protein [Bdellovibrionota bacterium]
HPAAADVQPNWPAYFKGKATTAGMDPGAVSVSPEKKGNPGTSTTESMYELQLKRINVRQLTQFAYYVENGDQPVKLKNLKIETDGNEGYLNASLDISSFALKKEDDNDTPKPREHH